MQKKTDLYYRNEYIAAKLLYRIFFHSGGYMSDSFERGINVLKQPLSILPEHISDLVLEHIRQSIHYEPVIGIMGKTGAGKSSLCNALFEHPLSPVSHAEGCTRKPLHFTLNAGGRSLTLVDLPGVVAH
ncbi:50S ribosome-binding GTPase [Escherichia coli]|nr:50S ribosome-binding GTPase [Escherichia coli]